jgi:outer membrane lipoprotein
LTSIAMRLRLTLSVILLLLLSACASGPTFNTGGVDRSLTPRGVAAEPQLATRKSVLWGGTILTTSNLKDRTRIEVLAYPLDTDKRPQRDSDPLGRFILERAGFLEPASYAEGRQVTAIGRVTGIRAGRVDETDYTYPVIDARQLYLWPRDRGYSGSNVHFGIGVGSGGHWGGGVGVGF